MRATLISLVLVVGACSPDDPAPRGNLEGPTGLAVANRDAEDGFGRNDLFIADSQAQGVKIVQLTERRDSSGVLFTTSAYVAAPAISFPLAIPAPGFTQRLALARSDNPDRLFGLASATGHLHVMNVQQAPFFATWVEPSNTLIDSVSLDLVDPNWSPIDLAVVSTSGTRSIIAISFRVPGEDVGRLGLVAIDAPDDTPASLRADLLDTVEVVGLPERIDARIAPAPSVIVSNGLGAVVSVVPVMGEAFGPVTEIDVGGPTFQAIDAAEAGAYVLRVDRSSVVHLAPSGDTLARSTKSYESPFTPSEEVSPPGRIDLRESPIAAGAFGVIEALVDPLPQRTTSLQVSGGVNASDQRITAMNVQFPGEVLLVSHIDGFASFVTGLEADLPISSEPRVVRISQVGTGEQIDVDECPSAQTLTCPPTETPTCEANVVLGAPLSYQIYRATFQGALVESFAGVFDVLAQTATTATVRVTDPFVTSFVTSRLVRAGDTIELQQQSLLCDRDLITGRETVSAKGVVIDVDEEAVDVLVDTPFEVAANCNGNASVLSTAYTIYPSSPEMVLTDVLLGTIRTVAQRVPVQTSTGAMSATFGKELGLTVRASAFACVAGAASQRSCVLDANCGDGRECAREEGAVSTCPVPCAAACEDGMDTCMPDLMGRACSSIEFEVLPRVLFTIDLDDTSSADLANVPTDAAFSSLDGSWYVSFPGSRSITRVVTSLEGTGTVFLQ